MQFGAKCKSEWTFDKALDVSRVDNEPLHS